jgi:hypothetical protein
MPKRRMERERRTIEAMFGIYCHAQHGDRDGLCDECQELLDYARARLDRCPFRADKPTCARCPVHCYRPAMRAQIITVMRYAGPRMFFRHPGLAVQHLWDDFKKRDR